jgi:hypothetical protein
MKEIPLTQGKVALVDDEDFENIKHLHWYARLSRNHLYAAYKVKRKGKSTIYYMHRVIMQPPEHLHIDHIDGNGLNNQRSNLRLCTHQENQRNRSSAQSNSKSGVKGVSWHKSSGKWRAVIKYEGKHKHIGAFSSIEDAAIAYRNAEIKLFGEFAHK